MRQRGAPGAPCHDELQNFDMAEMEERVSHVVYPDDEWADTRWGGNGAPRNVNLLKKRQKTGRKIAGRKGAGFHIAYSTAVHRKYCTSAWGDWGERGGGVFSILVEDGG